MHPNMANALKQIISLAVFIGILYGGVWIFKDWRRSGEELPPGLTLYSDGTASLIGVVIKNETGCRGGSALGCTLTVQSGNKRVEVQYDTSDDYFCANEKTAAMGLNMDIGQNIRASGVYRKDGDSYSVNTCASADYYIVAAN